MSSYCFSEEILILYLNPQSSEPKNLINWRNNSIFKLFYNTAKPHPLDEHFKYFETILKQCNIRTFYYFAVLELCGFMLYINLAIRLNNSSCPFQIKHKQGITKYHQHRYQYILLKSIPAHISRSITCFQFHQYL